MEENAQNLEVILQDCLKKIRSGEDNLDSALARYPQIATDLRPLLEAALWIQSRQAALQPRTGFVNASRARLVEQIKKEQMALPASRKSTWWESVIHTFSAGTQQRRAFQFVTVMVLVLALLLTAGGTGVARASQGALPGQLLYSVKRTIEKAELALTPDEAGKAQLYIENARTRLDEIQSLVEANQTNQIDETISLFEDHVYNAVSIMVAVRDQDTTRANQLAEELNSTLQEKSGVLRGMASSASPQVNQEINRLLSVSDGMVVLMEDHFPSVATTPIFTPTLTNTPGLAVVIPSPVETLTAPAPISTPPSKPILVIPDPFELTYTPTLTSTISITSTVSISSNKANYPTQSQRDKEKPDKKPKKEKTKPPHPDPSRRPDKPGE